MTTVMKEKVEEVQRKRTPRLVMYAEGSEPEVQMPGQGIVAIPLHFSLKTIYEDRARYIIPDYQRKPVWTKRDAAMCLFMMLRGSPIDPVKVFQDFEDNIETREVADGQQRLRSIWDFFAGKIALPTQEMIDRALPGCSIPPLAPGKFYVTTDHRNEISPSLKTVVDTLVVPFVLMNNVPRPWRRDLFRGWQMGHTLSLGQVLFACGSQVEAMAKRLASHPFWYDTYKHTHAFQEDLNNLCYQGALEFIALECLVVNKGTIYHMMDKSTMTEWAGGKHDSLLFTGVERQIQARLARCAHIFGHEDPEKSAQAVGRTDAIIMAQASHVLEDRHGYSFEVSERGCLAVWAHKMRQMIKSERTDGYYTVSSRAVYANIQAEFWKNWLPYLKTEVPGLKKRSDFASEAAYEARMIEVHS